MLAAASRDILLVNAHSRVRIVGDVSIVVRKGESSFLAFEYT